MQTLFEKSRKQTGIMGVYQHEGKHFMFEPSSVEHRDGAITGGIWELLGDIHAEKIASVKRGQFKIASDGKIERGLGLKNLLNF